MRVQLKRLGYSYDWRRELATCHPGYYVHEQRFFLDFLKRGLVYRKLSPQNWCETCGTVLANEQVIDGRCWRCDQPVVQKDLEQWFLRITAYADELLADLDKLVAGWPERVLTMMVWPCWLTMDLTRDRAMRPVCWAMMDDWAISRAAVPPMWNVRMTVVFVEEFGHGLVGLLGGKKPRQFLDGQLLQDLIADRIIGFEQNLVFLLALDGLEDRLPGHDLPDAPSRVDADGVDMVPRARASSSGLLGSLESSVTPSASMIFPVRLASLMANFLLVLA